MNQVAFILLGLVIAIAGNMTLSKSALEKKQTLESEASQAQTQLEQAQAQAAKLPQLRQEVVAARAQMTELKNKFPASENLGILVDDLEATATESGLSVESINRQVSPSSIPGFNQVNLNMLTSGDYPSALKFMQAAYKNERLLNVTSFESGDGKQTLSVTGYIRQPLPGESK